jgi:hypothetical protein
MLLVEVVDLDVGVVIRFVAMEIIPRERLAQEKADAKRRFEERSGRVSRTLRGRHLVSRSKPRSVPGGFRDMFIKAFYVNKLQRAT